MTVAELQAALQAALDRGLPPDTTVVLSVYDWFVEIDETNDPSEDDSQFDMWFTLHPGQEADSRSTPGGMR